MDLKALISELEEVERFYKDADRVRELPHAYAWGFLLHREDLPLNHLFRGEKE